MSDWYDRPYADLEDDFSSRGARKQVERDWAEFDNDVNECQKKSASGWKIAIQIAIVLVLIGAINWFVVGVTGFSNPNNSFDLVKPTLGPIWVYLPYIIYFIIGIAGFVLVWALIAKSIKQSKSKKRDKGNDWDLGY